MDAFRSKLSSTSALSQTLDLLSGLIAKAQRFLSLPIMAILTIPIHIYPEIQFGKRDGLAIVGGKESSGLLALYLEYSLKKKKWRGAWLAQSVET